MDKLLLATIIIVGLAMLLLSLGVLIKGKFANTHVSGNKALAQRGVRCATTQDREARRPNSKAVSEHRKP
ncbi:MAG: hypothetical protein Q4D66_04320 [Bacteroidales bacterium]|nr:hypothetical protein [Bacteroidales bacterium]